MLKKVCSTKVLMAAAVSFGTAAIMQPATTQAETVEVPVKVEIKKPLEADDIQDLDFGKINVAGAASVVMKANTITTYRYDNEAAAKTATNALHTAKDEGTVIVDGTKNGKCGIIAVSTGGADMKFDIEIKYPDADISLGDGVVLKEMEDFSSPTEITHENVAGSGGGAKTDITAIFVGGKVEVGADAKEKTYSKKVPIEISFK